MKLQDHKDEINKVIESYPEFKKSTRGKNIYNAENGNGEQIKIQTSGNNFKYFVDGYKVRSVPMSKITVEWVKEFIEKRL